jgi:hypothetical protein
MVIQECRRLADQLGEYIEINWNRISNKQLLDIYGNLLIEVETEITDWYPVEIDPVHDGQYQVITTDLRWPLPMYALWASGEWNIDTVTQWRGLTAIPPK